MARYLRAVLVGCGGISRRWLDAVEELPDVDVVGLVDLREAAARERAGQYGLDDALIATDLDAALDALTPDVVLDCTVPSAHYPVTMAALAHGCHVMGEKPLADSMPHAREMVAAARAADRLFAVMQNRRYNPQLRRLASFVASGVLGRITTVNCDFYIGAHFGGFRERMEHVLLLDMAIHTFDAARLITGGDARAVYCHEWNPPGSWYDHDASAVAVFEMTDEVVYTYRGSWCAEGLNTSWESAWHVVGERGSVAWDGHDGFRAEVVAESGGFFSTWEPVPVPPYEGERTGGHTGALREFVHCVRTGCVPETVGSDNIQSLAMVFGAIESATTGARVEIPG